MFAVCRLKVEELTEQANACRQSKSSEEEYAKRLELAMAEMRQQMQQQEQQRETEYAEKLTAMKQEASAVKDELKARLLSMDSLCEQLQREKESAIAEVEERHRLRLLSIAESQEEQVCLIVACTIVACVPFTSHHHHFQFPLVLFLHLSQKRTFEDKW